MPVPHPEAARASEEKPPRDATPKSAPEEGASVKPTNPGGIKSWLPLGAALLLMPLLAYVLTTFVLVPRMQKALVGTAGSAEPTNETRAEAAGGAETALRGAQGRSAAINKLLVNVAGTMGSRYLLTSLTLLGQGSAFANQVTDKEPQLRDMASGLLSLKTIADLEKPGARNLLRGELLAGFNSILGNGAVQEIYFTEFAIQ